jgi:hypothetical protein
LRRSMWLLSESGCAWRRHFGRWLMIWAVWQPR